MNHASCPKEEAVAQAARNGEWPEPVAAHAADCAVCRDVAQAASWMQVVASSAEPSIGPSAVSSESSPLPNPGLVWWRAHLADGPAETRRIRTALECVQIALTAAAPIGLAAWVTWNWYPIEAMAEQFLMNALPEIGSITYALASLAPAALTLAVLSLAYPLLAGD